MAKTQGATSFKTTFRMERAIRLELQGVPDSQIAAAIGLTPAGLATMKQGAEYQQMRMQLASGVLSEIDEETGEDFRELRRRVRSSVPLALQAIQDCLQQRLDGKLRLSAAESLLDRDGRFVKTSRTSIVDDEDLQASFISKKDEDIANALSAATPLKKETVQ